MGKRNYEEEAGYLAQAADIAIEAIKAYPPDEFNKEQIDHLINFYLDSKERILNPKPEYANMRSLKYLYQDIFTVFQEGTFLFVEVFWKKIKEANLPFERTDYLKKILKKGKISNRQEYDYVLDVIVALQQEGKISDDEVHRLNGFIEAYEKK